MIYTGNEAREKMDEWGRQRTPFLFLIDFEMHEIRLFRLEDAGKIPVRYSIGPNVETREGFLGSPPTWEVEPVSFPIFEKAFHLVQQHIRHGNSYLLNLTFPSRIRTNLSLEQIFDHSRAKYKLLWPGRFVVFSPESFVRIRGNTMLSYPMKGTIDAGLPEAAKKLIDDRKELAEHYTIVDLIRNDLGRISEKVQVNSFRYLEKINGNKRQLFQTSSEILGELAPNWHARLGSILFDLLPAGSVSGAPKQKTLEIIREAESGPRGFYTGVFGVFDGVSLDSAVMIRFIEKRGDDLFFRSGGGITSQSRLEEEYQELIHKIYLPLAI